MLIVADVIEALTGYRPTGADHRISAVVVDPRQVTPGALFVAIAGEGIDVPDTVKTAFEMGASLVLVEHEVSITHPVLDLRTPMEGERVFVARPPACLIVPDGLAALQKIARFRRRRLALRVVGITGSVGKSTTKELVADVLDQRYRTARNPAPMNNALGVPLTLLNLGQNYSRLVLEMNLYVPGEVALLSDLALPQVGVITNISTVVAVQTGIENTIPRSRTELLQALPPAPEGVAVLNYDDPWVRDIAGLTRARVFFYGLDSKADLWADGVEGLGLEGVRFRLHYRNETIHLRVPLIGRYSVHTALRAAAVGLVEGLTWQEIVNGLRSGHSQLRLVTVQTSNGALILDDTYSASPESTLAALNLLEELEGRRVAVLGDMSELGPYEGRGHEMVGVRAAEVVDELVTVGERGRIIAASARAAGLNPRRIHTFDEGLQAIDFLKQRLKAKDIVLIKGSYAMRMDRIVGALESRE